MKKLTIFILSILLTINLFGNGGPVDAGAVYRIGDIVLINMPYIKLIKEDLKIKIEGDYSFVEVNYLLQNESIDSKITYGFPIDFLQNNIDINFQWEESNLPEIKFILDNKPLEIKHQVDYSVFEENSFFDNQLPLEIHRSWYVVDFNIEEKKSVILKVIYKIKNGFEDWATTKNFFTEFSNRHFIYDFKPAKNWNDGIISEFNLELNVKDIVLNKGNLNISGLSLLDNKTGIYTTSIKNFDLKKAPNLLISYENKHKLSEEIIHYLLPTDKIKNIKTSSEVSSDYTAKNMFDLDFNTTWAVRDNGNSIGEKIEIELDKYHLGAICFLNGYTKNEAVYTENNRIKKLRLEIEYVDFNDSTKSIIESREISIKDIPFSSISKNNFGNMLSIIEDFGDGYLQIKKITLTILEVYKGTKYSDTCISEIFLLGYQ